MVGTSCGVAQQQHGKDKIMGGGYIYPVTPRKEPTLMYWISFMDLKPNHNHAFPA
jgi:hypothetical protein